MKKDLCHYIFELGALKKFRHSGTLLAGVQQPDSIAEHAYRTTIIGMILAEMEGANMQKVAMICLFHDNAEARITDLHKVARRYLDSEKAELQAFTEQSERLPKSLGKKALSWFQEYEGKKTTEAIIARDADMLETAFQAKEYLDIGHTACKDWIDNVKKCLKTTSARALIKEMEKTPFTEWWQGLKKIDISY